MSSKSSKKVTAGLRAPEPIITRTKSAQQRRQLRNKDNKTEKPKLTKPEIKSPKHNKNVIRSKKALLKDPVKSSVEVLEQVEYYPNKLKRDISTKKIMLKPKHNFKVIAATNKRKLATPQKGLKSPPPKQSSIRNVLKSPKRSRIATKPCSSPELSMQDMVRIMEETRSLSDEDFMEILTCPSPVWWEDPPDGEYKEDSIYTRSPEPEKSTNVSKKRKNRAPSKSNNNITITGNNSEQFKVIKTNQDERFVKKKQKLENILGIIKNKTIKSNNGVKNNKIDNDGNRKMSESEGDISDMSFNEEEILKNLENMEIPVEQSVTESVPGEVKNEIDNKEIKKETIENYENELMSKNDNVDRKIKLPVEVKPEIKEEISINGSVSDIDSIPRENSQFKSDLNTNIKSDEIVLVDSCTNSSLGNNEDSKSLLDVECSSNSGIGNKILKVNALNINDSNISTTVNNNDILPNKKSNDLSEYITVYKIIPEKLKRENNPENEQKPDENTKKTKLDTVRGKLNDFFKQCKNNKRIKKCESPIPANPLTDVTEQTTDSEKQNVDNKIDLEDEKIRLKGCDYCIEKTENGTTYFSCEKCEMAPILPCDLCNFLADTKEVYRKHVSTCKDVARISWNHNYVLNQT